MFRYTFTQDKNILHIEGIDRTDGRTRSYTFDINTAIFANSKGKALQAWPEGFTSCLKQMYRADCATNAIFLLHTAVVHPWNVNLGFYNNGRQMSPADLRRGGARPFLISDKMNSIGYRYRAGEDIRIDTLDFIDKNFKLFAKYVAENPNCTLEEFQRAVKRELWFTEFPEFERYHLDDRMKDALYSYCNGNGTLGHDDIVFCAYVFSRGLGEFLGNYRSAAEKVMDYVRMCRLMEKPIGKCDFYREYINVKREYEVKRDELEDKKIVLQHSQHLRALTFENDRFVVIVPMTSQAFKEEADSQRNCVYSMYLDTVKQGRTNVVFIRRKNDVNISYITCEVSNSGQIRQYLCARNTSVRDDDACAFRFEYQNWLKENWDRG